MTDQNHFKDQDKDQNFRPIAVAELLDGKHHFVIPSFQRGYRWEKKQVLDLLEDIRQFVVDQSRDNKSYFLQPIVVKKEIIDQSEVWIVLDGQQRLTTLLLILKQIHQDMRHSEFDLYSDKLYDISYKTRLDLNFDAPNQYQNIDSYFLHSALTTIKQWLTNNNEIFDNVKEALFYKTKEKQVKFIWYAVDGKNRDLEDINIFNRLNRGKIKLTNSELIKALFIMDNDAKLGNEHSSSEQMSIEWNEMERKFQDDKFWYFINDNRNYETRIDLLFDFVTENIENFDDDEAYRKFQNLYDHCRSHRSGLNEDNRDSLWKNKNIASMEQAWLEIKFTYDRMIAWYEDEMFYHYIGFLTTNGMSPLEIHKKIADAKEQAKASSNSEWTIDDTEKVLHRLICDKFKLRNQHLDIEDIDNIKYESEHAKRLLLLFNVETCKQSHYLRFPFKEFRLGSWDIEHIIPRKLERFPTREAMSYWLKDIIAMLDYEIVLLPAKKEEVEKLRKECGKFIQADDLSINDEKFGKLYEKIYNYFIYGANKPSKIEIDIDNISNLTLLDSSTNREYKNRPFSSKRYKIIEYDRNTKKYIPICTRNVFLKYYTASNSNLDLFEMMRWNDNDRAGYLKAIHEALDHIFLSVQANGDTNDN